MLFCLLLLIAIVDIKTYRIPNLFILVAFLLMLLLSHLRGGSLLLSLSKFLVMGLLLNILRHLISQLKQQEALGRGDIKLIAVLSMGIPLADLWWFITLSGIGGIATSLIMISLEKTAPLSFSNKGIFPFAPSICLAFLLTNIHEYSNFFSAILCAIK